MDKIDEGTPTPYGFRTATYEGGFSLHTLRTGDGKTEFTDLIFPDGTASIGISYGRGKGIGVKTVYNKTLDADMGITWQVQFDNQESVDQMIETLLRVKNNLALGPATRR